MSWKKRNLTYRNIEESEEISKDIICQVNEALIKMKQEEKVICEIRMDIFYSDDSEATRLENINQCKRLLIKIFEKYKEAEKLDTIRRMELEKEFTVIYCLFHEDREYSYTIDEINKICDEIEIPYSIESVEYSATPLWRIV